MRLHTPILSCVVAWLLGLSLAGCPTPPTLLVVDLKTDVKPFVEFDSIDTEVFALSDEAYATPVRPRALTVAREIDDPVAGVRLAEFEGLAPGSWRVRVRLMRGADEVASRRALVRVRSARVVTILITRDCEGVVCPDEGGDPTTTECLAGRCVVEECTPETPELCPERECASDDQCAPVAGAPPCAEGVCFDRFCATAFNDEGCAGALQCVVEGCRQVFPVDAEDAGPLDAGADAGPMDAGLDAGPLDAGVDAGPGDAGVDAGPGDAGVDAGVPGEVAQLTAGWGHTCARLGSGELRCWGENQSGQLGDGTSGTDRLLPVAVMGVADAVELTAGWYHTCARLGSGEVRCWGRNDEGQLGDGTSGTNRLLPVAVMGVADAVELTAGWRHTCARLGSGEVRCWGSNTQGQLGDGTSGTDRLLPVAVMGVADAVELTAGYHHTCARLGSGEVHCWGRNAEGQLGDGTSGTNRLLPVAVMGVADAVELTAGWRHTCARLGSGEVRCWGSNTFGQLGDGTSGTDRLLPVAVMGVADNVELTAGGNHTCARLGSGEVRCWGSNTFGQLGDGTSGTDRLLPVPVMGVDDAVELAAGDRHTCARLGSGELRCWGENQSGQLGDGTSGTDRLLPVAVMGLE